MARSSFLRKRTLLVLPAVLLTINLLQDMASCKNRQHVLDVHTRVAITLALVGAAYAVAGDWLSPWLERALTTTRQGSLRHAGTVGLFLFYVVAYGGLYYAYLVDETRGPGALLPARLR
jgi:hypothetical protein